MQQAVLIDHTTEATRTPENGARVVKCEIVPINGQDAENDTESETEHGFFMLLSFEAVFDFALMQYQDGIDIYQKWKGDYYTLFVYFLNSAFNSLNGEYRHILQILSECKTTEDQAKLYTMFLHLGEMLPHLFIEDYRQGLANCRALRSYLAEAKKAAALLVLEYKEPRPIV